MLSWGESESDNIGVEGVLERESAHLGEFKLAGHRLLAVVLRRDVEVPVLRLIDEDPGGTILQHFLLSFADGFRVGEVCFSEEIFRFDSRDFLQGHDFWTVRAQCELVFVVVAPLHLRVDDVVASIKCCAFRFTGPYFSVFSLLAFDVFVGAVGFFSRDDEGGSRVFECLLDFFWVLSLRFLVDRDEVTPLRGDLHREELPVFHFGCRAD